MTFDFLVTLPPIGLRFLFSTRLASMLGAGLLLSLSASMVAQASDFVLKDLCPPSFEQMDGGVCRLVTLYDQYDSLQGQGVGGTKTELPARRDGFTARQIDLGRYLFFDPLPLTLKAN
ncbi:MAG: hypothetical protein AAF194_01945 [Pseudomonadota bacterium]